MRWDDGYVTDVAYTSNVYREATPSWLALTALLFAQRPPDLARPFRYADLGCGNGMTAVVVAATCPHAEVWGFDFNPAHIETARTWAAAAGLTNITFVETSFADLAARDAGALPEFDFIVAHGVLSWISPANQRLVIEIIGQRLRAGGLASVTYNVTTGWAAMQPLQTLMHQIAQARPERADLALPAIFDQLTQLKDGGAKYFTVNPAVEARLDSLRNQDGRYLAHELLNADWHPLMAATVMDAMAAAKCQFLGSATLTENYDAVSQPPAMLPLIAAVTDPRLRETLRDLGMAQAFRRDVYRRGMVPLQPAEHAALLDAVGFTRIAPSPVGDVAFATAAGTVVGRPEIYQPLLALFADAPPTLAPVTLPPVTLPPVTLPPVTLPPVTLPPVTLATIRQAEAFTARPTGEVLQALMLLVAGGYIHPMLPDPAAGQATARALNRAIARASADGLDMPRLAAPAIGSVISADALETAVIGQLLDGAAADETALARHGLEVLRHTGRTLRWEGEVVEDPIESRRRATELVHTMLGPRAALLRTLGVLGEKDTDL